MDVTVIVLAAGQGKRMHSELPKVLHEVAGKSMLEHVLDIALQVTSHEPIVVHGHAGKQLQTALEHRDLRWAEQAEQLGTGHAVAQALPYFETSGTVLILYGDVPLLTASALRGLLEAAKPSGFAVLTAMLDDPSGYGRMVRDPDGNLTRIVEHKDANPQECAIREYYLTDCVEMAVGTGISVGTSVLDDHTESIGVNDRVQLAEVERIFQSRVANRLLKEGVTLRDPSRIDVRGELVCGRDVVIDVNVVFSGAVKLGDGVRIGPNNVISESVIGNNVEVLSNCVIESAAVGHDSKIGPFARLRPDARLDSDVHIGNFVEIKKSDIGTGSKVNHLAYVGDAQIGRRVNVGAGTITCNYDGAYKHLTVLEDDVFVGSDTQLVAPVRVGAGVTIAAGTTVTDDVAPDRLVLSRVRQKTVSGWRRPKKK